MDASAQVGLEKGRWRASTGTLKDTDWMGGRDHETCCQYTRRLSGCSAIIRAIIVAVVNAANVVWFRVGFNMLLLPVCQSQNSSIGWSYDESKGSNHSTPLLTALPDVNASAIDTQRHVWDQKVAIHHAGSTTKGCLSPIDIGLSTDREYCSPGQGGHFAYTSALGVGQWYSGDSRSTLAFFLAADHNQ